MSAGKPVPVVTQLPVAPMLLELRSERIGDALRALMDAGFKVSNVPGHINRFRIEDAKEQKR